MELSQLTQEFYMEMRLQNRTPATIKSYRWYLERFLKYLDEEQITYLDQLDADVLKRYQMQLTLGQGKTGRQGAAHANPYLMPVRSFLHFLKRAGYRPEDPAHALTTVKIIRRLPKTILTREEMVDLIEAPDTTNILGYRDRTIMEVLYSTAIRRNELRSLTVPAIDFESGLIRVFGKGQKERMAPLGRIALQFLETYLRSVRPLLVKDGSENHLFLSIKGRKLSRNVVGEFLVKYARMVGIDKRVTPHTFRHTCATLMLRNGADVRHIQMLLGHESLESTQIYTHVAVTDLRKMLQKYHPREITLIESRK